ncbi:MAG: hypothetical protein QGG05_18335, partial [Candidatus Latescibacteria bacterium]|nr:hypothetical protein [Candidatus Latescibacterota bacterium]
HEDTYTPRHPLNYLHEVKDSIIKDDGDIVVITLTKGEGDESSDTVTNSSGGRFMVDIPHPAS